MSKLLFDIYRMHKYIDYASNLFLIYSCSMILYVEKNFFFFFFFSDWFMRMTLLGDCINYIWASRSPRQLRYDEWSKECGMRSPEVAVVDAVISDSDQI